MFKDYQFFSNNLQDAARQILEAQAMGGAGLDVQRGQRPIYPEGQTDSSYKTREEIEQDAMNPSGAFTPTPKNMKQREDSMVKASQDAQAEEDISMKDELKASAIGMPTAFLAPSLPLTMAGVIGVGGALAGAKAGKMMGMGGESNLELEKIRKTAPATSSDYAKAAAEAAARRTARGIY
jgi:hypothetical protein